MLMQLGFSPQKGAGSAYLAKGTKQQLVLVSLCFHLLL